MLLFSKLWYNVLMNRKVSKIDYKILARYILVLGTVIGVLMTTNGVLQIKTYKEEAGTDTIEEINEKYNPLIKELSDVENEWYEEYATNGDETERYKELSEKRAALKEKVNPLYTSRYMKQTGYHNPRSISEYFSNAPTLGIGLATIVVTVISVYIFLKLDRENAKAERAANKKAEEKESK